MTNEFKEPVGDVLAYRTDAVYYARFEASRMMQLYEFLIKAGQGEGIANYVCSLLFKRRASQTLMIDPHGVSFEQLGFVRVDNMAMPISVPKQGMA